MPTESIYHKLQPLLFSLAYRMLGSVMDAEDIVQDSFIAFYQLPNRDTIENKKAYLCKIVTNRCLDLIRSSSKQRELYVGPWLPEPLVQLQDESNDPSQTYLQQESISTAYLLLLQQLNANERAVFLLREVFQYSYGEIGDMIGKSSANCRQIFHRAKKSIHHEADDELTISLAENTVKDFIESMLKGNVNHLLELLHDDVVFYSDGGGKVTAAKIPIIGAEAVAQIQLNLANKYSDQFTYQFTIVNGWPGVVIQMDNNQKYVYSFELESNRIKNIFAVANPDKLRHL
ncbi:RNA polymerase sigma factor SigJ [Bacillus sp. SA1-12]|uniref:RNA polymerase sigma-70 factor n=1 Tax=Bacillus sp. SA1-12 TaxID=1455638 RepID=UPI0006256A50|nr:RNA polymerase sigma-70 factor [Bacillus sp. SA1-12]KKI92792.1 RNA polymerase sigma factor SigJ [Bacillus sp. SA1-12]